MGRLVGVLEGLLALARLLVEGRRLVREWRADEGPAPGTSGAGPGRPVGSADQAPAPAAAPASGLPPAPGPTGPAAPAPLGSPPGLV